VSAPLVQVPSASSQPAVQLQPPAPEYDRSVNDLQDLFGFNALANVADLPDIGRDLGNSWDGSGLPGHPLQPHSLFDFDAYFHDDPGFLPDDASQQTTRVQPTNGAPSYGSDRPGFAAGSQ